jgi:hypothetical protein
MDVGKAALRLACRGLLSTKLVMLDSPAHFYCKFSNEQDNVNLKEKNGRPNHLGLQAGDVSMHRLHIHMQLLLRTRPVDVLEMFQSRRTRLNMRLMRCTQDVSWCV